MNVNKAILVGRVGKDPEVRQAGNNKVVSFSLATTENYKDKDGNKQSVTEWHNLTAWGKLAEIVGKYVQKGSELYIEGKIRTRIWDDKDGQKRYTTEIVADNIQMGRHAGEKQEQQQSNTIPANNAQVVNNDDDQLPF